jgi:type II secretory pathway component GspD/PulD (secretin)
MGSFPQQSIPTRTQLEFVLSSRGESDTLLDCATIRRERCLEIGMKHILPALVLAASALFARPAMSSPAAEPAIPLKVGHQQAVPKARLLLEGLVLSISLDGTRDAGTGYSHGQASAQGRYARLETLAKGQVMHPSDFVFAGATNAVADQAGFRYLAQFTQDLDAALMAVRKVANGSNAKIMQRPCIETPEGQPAQLFIGTARPYPTASYYGGGAYISQLFIGLTLDVTSSLTPEGLVVMTIRQTTETLTGTMTIANVGGVPLVSRREAVASVTVRDRETILLGGWLETSRTPFFSEVDFLNNVPVLGPWLNQIITLPKRKTREEWVVLLRPTLSPFPPTPVALAKPMVE